MTALSLLNASGGLLSPIIGLAPFVQGGVKTQAGSSIRQQSSVPVLQVRKGNKYKSLFDRHHYMKAMTVNQIMIDYIPPDS